MSNRFDFDGRVAFVTGGASGIGAAVVARLLEGGASVAVADLRTEDLPSEVHPIGVDVSDSSSVRSAVEATLERYGRLDVAICSAGIGGDTASTVEVSDEEWQRLMQVNAAGTFYTCREALRPMLAAGYGRIVAVASIAGKEGNPTEPAYSASKAAVIALVKSIAKDVAGSGVLINSVAPAIIETPMIDQSDPSRVDYFLGKVPLGRMGKPAEVASMIAFLASEECSFSTGACFDASGGRAVY